MILKLAGKVANQIIYSVANCIGSTNDSAQMNEKDPEILISWLDFHNESSDLIIKMQHSRLPIYFESIFFEGVLIGIVTIECTFMVPSGDDVDVIRNRFVLGFNHRLVLEIVNLGFRVFLLQLLNVMLFAKV